MWVVFLGYFMQEMQIIICMLLVMLTQPFVKIKKITREKNSKVPILIDRNSDKSFKTKGWFGLSH